MIEPESVFGKIKNNPPAPTLFNLSMILDKGELFSK